jgi:hypothetical protein
MTIRFGYKASAEQFGPAKLLEYAVAAEQAGFDSVYISDHFQPWMHDGGHAPAALPWLGALGARTSRIVMGTSVLTPTFRYHPAVVAQSVATLAVLILWPRIDKRLPAHLVAVVAGSVLAWAAGLALDGRRVVGVETAQGTMRAPAVVANADAAQVARTWLTAATVRAPRVRLAASMSGWNGVIRARRRSDRPAHEVVFDAPYLNEFADIFDAQRAPQTPTIYLCAQEKAHGRAGWTDHEPLFVMVNAPSIEGVPSPTELTSAVSQRVLARLRALGRIDADDALVWERHPYELADAFPGSHGGIYGSASNSRFAAFLRPANASKQIDGLFYASGSAHPGGGMPLCMLSGLRAADAVQRRTREAA